MSKTAEYIGKCDSILECIGRQEQQIQIVASWFADSIGAGRMVHLFGAGHSRIMVEEMWPRYGSFPGFNPIVELSLTFHNLVVGANGQRQAMFLEKQSGLAERILRNYSISPLDSALIISSSGCNTVPVEMARELRAKGCRVVALVSLKHCLESSSKSPCGKKLVDYADVVLDTGAPAGDAMISLEGLESPVAPGSTVGGSVIVNCIKAEVAQLLVNRDQMPDVLTASCVVGEEKAAQQFEAAYDEHGRRMARLLEHPGSSESASSTDRS